MRSITLEILRHGPPHNQLLSPLTPYLALCENHAAVTVTVPFEHAQFLQRLRALSYELKDSTRVFQLQDTGRELGSLLAKIPSLIAELSQRTCSSQDQLLHLRMIVSASELALLPFELVISPNGFPGEGRTLALQTTLPVCLTREVRQPSGVSPEWNRKGQAPRILFAVASPAGFDPVPLESHLLALRRAIDPWVFPPSADGGVKPGDNEADADTEDEADAWSGPKEMSAANAASTANEKKAAAAEKSAGDKQRALHAATALKATERLVVLPQATLEQIRAECAKGTFSHVHILAHGIAENDSESGERSYGLALHDSRDPARHCIVDGKALARTLRTDHNDNFAPASPLVVTLASCNAGTVGSVVNFAGAGASVAHALHSEGIPVVIASQFPLSFRGSVIMVETLYKGLLRGDDPRHLIHDLRGRLQGGVPDTHDWASLVAYAALPPGFERQLARFQVDQAQRQMSAALAHVDQIVNSTSNARDPAQSESGSSAYERVDRAKERLHALRSLARVEIDAATCLVASTQEILDAQARAQRHYSSISGYIAASEKRHAELLLRQKQCEEPRPPQPLNATQLAVTHMRERSMHAYWETFFYDRSCVWALVQHIFIQCLLGVDQGAATASAETEASEAESARSSAKSRSKGKGKGKTKEQRGGLGAASLAQPLPTTTTTAFVSSSSSGDPAQKGREIILPIERDPHLLWECALNASLADLHSTDCDRHLWARDNLLELGLLQIQLRKRANACELASARMLQAGITGKPDEHITAILAITGGHGFDSNLYSIHRQIKRFANPGSIFCDEVQEAARKYEQKLRQPE